MPGKVPGLFLYELILTITPDFHYLVSTVIFMTRRLESSELDLQILQFRILTARYDGAHL